MLEVMIYVRPDLPARSCDLLAANNSGRRTSILGCVTDEQRGNSYFLATVEVDTDQLARVPNVKLYSGMPV